MKFYLARRREGPVIQGIGVDYVGGRLKAAWEEAFSAYGLIGHAWERVLLIGMGASLLQILAQTGSPPPRSSLILEIEPAMVRLQEQHFDLPLPYEVLIGDAAATIYQVETQVDGLFVDAFIERQVPLSLLQSAFVEALKARMMVKGLLIWNVLRKSEAEVVSTLLEAVFPVVRVRRIGEHWFYLAALEQEVLRWPF
jgi:spermidine synthase